MDKVISTVVIEQIKKIECSNFAKNKWGNNLICCYSVNLTFNKTPYSFNWVLEKTYPKGVLPSPYNENNDFSIFKEYIKEGGAWKKTKSFIWEVDESIQMAIHHLYSNDKSIAVDFPIKIERKAYVKQQ